MGEILVKAAKLEGGRLGTVTIELHGLGERQLDREQLVHQAREGHQLIPVVGGRRLPTLLLLEVGDDLFIRADAQAVPADSLPDGL